MKRNCHLLVASSDQSADMLYAVGLFVPDPFIYLNAGRKPVVLLSDLEFNRVRRSAPHCEVHSLNRLRQSLTRSGIRSPGMAHMIRALLKERKIRKVVVPPEFPLGLERELKRLKIKVKVSSERLFPKRETKSTTEIRKISAALTMAEVGLAEAFQALKNARVGKNRRLIYHNAPLTSEKLRSIINTTIMQASGTAVHTIVAGGRQACDPHECGHGPLRANEPIVIDVFPRSQKTGYFGDITRTVVKGRASEAVRKLYDTVSRSQELAFGKIKAGARAADIHAAVQKFFVKEGYKTTRSNGSFKGFFHGLGHGLGLELHESPSLSEHSQDRLRSGNVVTVEPGLYYPGTGAVRLEDVVLVETHRARNLTRFEKILEI